MQATALIAPRLARAPALAAALPALAGRACEAAPGASLARLADAHVRCLSALAATAATCASAASRGGDAVRRAPLAPATLLRQVAAGARWQSQAASAQPAAAAAGGGPRVDAGDLQLDDLLLTPAALRKLAALRARAVADGKPDGDKLSLRVRVDGGGCSGFKYSFALEAVDPAEDDRVFGSGGARVLVDATSLDLIKGSTVDWAEEMMRAAFTIVNNPNSESSCGCGSSFSAKME
jgi:iron-sulfur cluster assembly 2